MPRGDPRELDRFVQAQAGVLPAVLDELARGRKRTHWIWFIFPQLKGLGASSMARHYGLESLAEAQAYLAHPLLGPRLRQCCELMLQAPQRSAHDILGSPDDMKFRSCVTLFTAAAPREPLFRQCLERYYSGQPDGRTLALLAGT
jgi:uncharacterized protein (DUF1810 family)